MNKPAHSFPRPLSEVAAATLSEGLARQGFASKELITRWATIVGADIAEYSEPMKIQWPRCADGDNPEPATLVLRVEGPMALEIQHLGGLILERVNRFFGWQAIGQIALRQAPLRRKSRPARPRLDNKAVERIAASLPEAADENLRQALGRLGAAIKRN
ncbi:MAG TPA: DciA family protein [Pseudolabrys sp.]|jgi:hypothetical protein|nr:DciA family protein [Pseudolabrys sp.]